MKCILTEQSLKQYVTDLLFKGYIESQLTTQDYNPMLTNSGVEIHAYKTF